MFCGHCTVFLLWVYLSFSNDKDILWRIKFSLLFTYKLMGISWIFTIIFLWFILQLNLMIFDRYKSLFNWKIKQNDATIDKMYILIVPYFHFYPMNNVWQWHPAELGHSTPFSHSLPLYLPCGTVLLYPAGMPCCSRRTFCL